MLSIIQRKHAHTQTKPAMPHRIGGLSNSGGEQPGNRTRPNDMGNRKERDTSGKFASGNGGRPKGAVNKTTAALKDAILTAAAEHGEDDLGTDGLKGYLRKVAREDVKAFAGLLGRVLPMTVGGDPDNPVATVSKIELVAVRPVDNG